MARQRAGQASAAFGRVGTAQIPASDNAGVSAEENESPEAGISAGVLASVTTPPVAGPAAGVKASPAGSSPARSKAGKGDRKRTSRKARGKAPRRVGRPAGPDRVQLSIRILASTDDRLDAAVAMTGQNPQTIVDAALVAYLDALGVPQIGR